jgi:biotin transporter BioY
MSDEKPLTIRKRPRIITALSLTHAALALFFLGGIVNLSIVISHESDDPDSVRGLLIGMAACGVFAFAAVVTALGFWLQTRWARPLAITSLGVIVLGLAIGFYDEGDWEWDVLPILIIFAALLAVHLLPAVARRMKEASSSSTDSVEVL